VATARVFVVEDSASFQAALKSLVEAVGSFAVVGTASGETAATDWLHKHREGWDIAVIDLLLDEGSGFSLVQRFHKEHPEGKVVVFSEFASPALAKKCLQFGAAAVFRKSELDGFVEYLEGLAPTPFAA
jgi:DNA-binding NarL/FixJ family response regulator